jgi:hypothetical protein
MRALHLANLLITDLPGPAAYTGDDLVITAVKPMFQAFAFSVYDYGIVIDISCLPDRIRIS